jgi:hypothetical protein
VKNEAEQRSVVPRLVWEFGNGAAPEVNAKDSFCVEALASERNHVRRRVDGCDLIRGVPRESYDILAGAAPN